MSWWRSSGRPVVRTGGRPNARRRAREAQDPPSPFEDDPVLRWAWRYRHELEPFYGALVLAILGGLGYDYAPALWPLALPVGGGVTAAAWFLIADRPQVRAYVLVVGAAATVWTAAAWRASPAHDWLVVTAFVGTLIAAIPRWWHYRRRERITARRGASRGARRELRRIVRRWTELSEHMGLAGSRVQRAEADEIGFTLTLALRAGLTATDVVGALPRIESVLQTAPGTTRLLPDLGRADRVFVTVVRNDPLATTIPWPGTTATSISDPIALGRFEDGEDVSFLATAGHTLIGGSTGRGKSGVLNVILAEVHARVDVVVWGLDMKRGLELAPWRRVLGRLAVTEAEAFEALSAVNHVLDARARLLAERGERAWKPTSAEPALMVVIDELAELATEAMALFERLARLGRAAGIVLVAATQRPSAAALGGLDSRTQMTTRISLGVNEARDVELILGPGRIAAGWRADRLGGPGYFLIAAPGRYEVPRPARAYWLTDVVVRATAGQADSSRPALEWVSADAAAGPQQPPESADATAPVIVQPHPQDADEALLAALRRAPSGGLSPAELAAGIDRGRTWVFARLRVHEAAGRVVRVDRGRWAARTERTREDGQ